MTMTRGFPRPQFKVEKCQTNRTWDESSKSYKYGGYGETWDNKTYPMPYTAEEASISTLHSGRLQECTEGKLCIACGEAVEADVVSLLLQNGEIHMESGPFHDRCAKLTAAMCPHIRLDPSYEFVKRPWSEVAQTIIGLAS